MRRGETYRALVRGCYTSYIAVTDVQTTDTGLVTTAVEVLLREGLVPTISTVTLTEMEAASYHYIPAKVYNEALTEAADRIRAIVRKAQEGSE